MLTVWSCYWDLTWLLLLNECWLLMRVLSFRLCKDTLGWNIIQVCFPFKFCTCTSSSVVPGLSLNVAGSLYRLLKFHLVRSLRPQIVDNFDITAVAYHFLVSGAGTRIASINPLRHRPGRLVKNPAVALKHNTECWTCNCEMWLLRWIYCEMNFSALTAAPVGRSVFPSFFCFRTVEGFLAKFRINCVMSLA